MGSGLAEDFQTLRAGREVTGLTLRRQFRTESVGTFHVFVSRNVSRTTFASS